MNRVINLRLEIVHSASKVHFAVSVNFHITCIYIDLHLRIGYIQFLACKQFVPHTGFREVGVTDSRTRGLEISQHHHIQIVMSNSYTFPVVPVACTNLHVVVPHCEGNRVFLFEAYNFGRFIIRCFPVRQIKPAKCRRLRVCSSTERINGIIVSDFAKLPDHFWTRSECRECDIQRNPTNTND